MVTEARSSPERLVAQMRQLTNELGRTNSSLQRKLSQVTEADRANTSSREAESEEFARLVSMSQEIVDNGKEVDIYVLWFHNWCVVGVD